MIDTEKYVKIVSSQTEKPKTAVIEINNQDITITENGVYTAGAGYTGIGTATVNVPQPEPVIESINITPTTSEQTITASGGTDGYSPITVSAVTNNIDANIVAENIKSGVSILGVTGNVTELNGETVNITPTTSQQIIQPTGLHNGITQATVSAVTSSIDANITAENIRNGVSILGITGNINPAPAYYIEKTKDANGKAQQGSYLMDFSQFTDVGNYVFSHVYYANHNISGVIDFSSLTTISGINGCNNMFYGCSGLTSANLSSLTTISGTTACNFMFYGCEGLTSVDLSSLTTISGRLTCQYMFAGCELLTSIDLSSLTTISGSTGCSCMFQNCIRLASIDLSSLTTISGNNACESMFQNCRQLTTLSFPSLTSTGFGSYTNQFNNMLDGVTGCTVHFPSNLQSVIGSWSDVTAGFGGTNTTVLFDLPATE